MSSYCQYEISRVSMETLFYQSQFFFSAALYTVPISVSIVSLKIC